MSYALQVAPASVFDAAAIARQAQLALLLELRTWPKPGLVSHRDRGAHDDMESGLFRSSAAAIAPFFERLAQAGFLGAGMGLLREIGLQAEAAMMVTTAGVNTHRGAIFGMGLLAAAAGVHAAWPPQPRCCLGGTVRNRWGEAILQGPVPLHSHGAMAQRRYGAGGARLQAAEGFPAIYRIALPALRAARAATGGDEHAARVHACFALIASIDDTNLLHRGGPAGLAYAQEAARSFLRRGGVAAPAWREHAVVIHGGFIARRLSPGGAADLLAMSLFVERIEAVA